MTVRQNHFISVHPMLVFWMGLLTGAVLVALIFFYRLLAPGDYESYLLRSYYSPLRYNTTTSLDSSTTTLDPYATTTTTTDSTRLLNPDSYVSSGTPVGD